MQLKSFENSGRFRIVFKKRNGNLEPTICLDISPDSANFLEVATQLNEYLLDLNGNECSFSSPVSENHKLGDHTRYVNLNLVDYINLPMIINLFITSGFEYVE